jgi:SAM-dependent methyltransferase
MNTSLPEQEQLPLPAIETQVATTPQPVEATQLADATARLAHAQTRLADAIAYIRSTEVAARRKAAPLSIPIAATLRRLAAGLLCQVLPPPVKPILPRLPRISVIALSEGEDAIGQTIESVLSQGYPALELIVADVGAVDRPHDALKRYEPLLTDRIAAPGNSLEAGAAIGLARATGEILTVLAPGDSLLSGVLGRVGTHAAKYPSDAIIVLDRGAAHGAWHFAVGPLDLDALATVPTVLPSGAFVRRIAYDTAGGLETATGGAPAPALWPVLARRHRSRRLTGQAVIGRAVPAQAEAELPLYATRASVLRRLETTFRHWVRPLDRHERLSFPLADAGALPDPAGPPRAITPVRCPATGRLPLELLFSSPDTRFGERLMSDIWYHPKSHCAAMSPLFDPAELRRLQDRENGEAPQIVTPDAAAPSPFRNWAGQGSFLRGLSRVALPLWFTGLLVRWGDPTERELRRLWRPRSAAPSILEIDCLDGDLLDRLKAQGWRSCGTESDEARAVAVRAKGHEVWQIAAPDLLRAIPAQERFDVVFMGHVLDRQADPVTVLQRAARLLTPEGALIVSIANLDSAQIDRFGPTWAHWHPPYHRFILSRHTLTLMASMSGLRLVRCRSFSNPYWSWLSLRLNELGLAGAVPHGLQPDRRTAARAATLSLACRLLYDWRGRGDYLYAVLKPDLGR